MYDDGLGPSNGEKDKKVDVIFARANVDERAPPGTADGSATSGARPTTASADDDGGENLMVMTEFINALLRLAAEKFGAAKLTLVRRFEELLERYIVPYAERALPTDALGYTLRTRRVQAILVKYKQPLREFFEHYAAADQTSADARDNQGSMNLAETLFFLNEGGL